MHSILGSLYKNLTVEVEVEVRLLKQLKLAYVFLNGNFT